MTEPPVGFDFVVTPVSASWALTVVGLALAGAMASRIAPTRPAPAAPTAQRSPATHAGLLMTTLHRALPVRNRSAA